MLDIATPIALLTLSISILIAVIRLIKGPTLPDRIVAMDLIGVLAVGFIVVLAASSAVPVTLDAAIVIALIGFVSTVAYATYVDVVARFPSNAEAVKKRDTTKASLIRSLDREASQAFQRQNLDLAITKWDRILELDANNRKARLERERALDLKKRMAEKFGKK